MKFLISAINISIDTKTGCSVIKYGVYPNKVGLQVFDREAATAMTAAFNDKLNRMANAFRGDPIYEGHPDDAEWAKANPQVRAIAVGRIREMKPEADGLHLLCAYNEDGKKLVDGDAPAYEAFSPNWGMLPITYRGRAAFRPVELNSIGLTNKPNIPGSYIGLNEALPAETQLSNPMKEHLIKLLAAFGITLAADATDAQATTAINEALPKATTAVADAGKLATAINEKATLQTQLTAAQSQVTTAVNETATLRTSLATERAARAGVVLTGAINEGRITEAQRAEWLGKFTAVGADFTSVQTELGKLKPAVNTKTKTSDLGGRRGAPGDAGKINAINEAVSAKMKESGLSHHEAYVAVKKAKPELFEKPAE